MNEPKVKTAAKFIYRIVVRDGKKLTAYTKGEAFEIYGRNGEVVQRYVIANITETIEQYEQFKVHIVYIVSDEFGNTLVKIHAWNDNLEIICNPK